MEEASMFAEPWDVDNFPKVWEDYEEASAFPLNILEDNALEGTPLV